MSTQLSLLMDIAETAPAARKADYDPMTDMWGQPAACEDCGAPNRRSGAYLICTEGHNRGFKLLGRVEHPLYEQFRAYRLSIGHPID